MREREARSCSRSSRRSRVRDQLEAVDGGGDETSVCRQGATKRRLYFFATFLAGVTLPAVFLGAALGAAAFLAGEAFFSGAAFLAVAVFFAGAAAFFAAGAAAFFVGDDAAAAAFFAGAAFLVAAAFFAAEAGAAFFAAGAFLVVVCASTSRRCQRL